MYTVIFLRRAAFGVLVENQILCEIDRSCTASFSVVIWRVYQFHEFSYEFRARVKT